MVGSEFPLAIVIRSFGKFGALDQAASKIGRVGAVAQRAGRAITLGVTLPAVLAGASIFRTAAAFESEFLSLQVLTDTTAEKLAGLEEQALKLGRSTIFSATDIAKAQGILARAGLEIPAIEEAIEPTANLAAAFRISLPEAAEIGTAAVFQLGREMTELSRVNDVLFRSAIKAKTSIQELSENFSFAAPVGAQFGLGLTEIAAATALVSQSLGSRAGTGIAGSLRLAAINLDKLSEIGLDVSRFTDARGELNSLLNLLREFERVGPKPSQILEIFGQRAGPALVQLLTIGSEGVVDFMAKIDEGTSIVDAAGVTMQGAQGATAGFAAALEGLQIAIAKSGVLESLTELIDGFANWIRELAETDPELLKLGTKIVAFVAIAGPILTFLGLVVSGIGAVGAALGTLAAFIGPTVGTIVFALGAVVLWWDRIVAGAKRVWDAVTRFVIGAFQWLERQIDSLVDLVPDWLQDFFGGGDTTVSVVGAAAAGGPALLAQNARAADLLADEARSRLEIDFKNVPRGVEIRDESDLPVDVNLGVNLGGF